MSETLFSRAAEYPEVTVEFGFSTVLQSQSVWGTGTWNVGKWSGRDVIWTDVTEYVRTISTTRERNRDVDQFPAGTMRLELSNADARFTPANTSGPYTSGGVTKIVPKVPVRVRATWNGVTYGLFLGRINSWQDDYPGQGKDCVTSVVCSDTSADLAAVTFATTASLGAGETCGQRLVRITNAANWNFGLVADTGAIATMQATTLGDNALSLAQLVADSDAGALFVDQDGQLVFQDSYYPTGARSSRASTAQITFGSGASEVRFTDPRLTYDDTLIYNEINYSRVGGSTQTSTDADSVSLYGVRTLERNDLIAQTDAQVKQVADVQRFKFRNPEYRVAGLVVVPSAQATVAWPLVLGSRFGDRCVAKVPTPSGITIQRDVFVSGVSHTIDRQAGWTVVFGFTSATPYANVWGGWDGTNWDTATWFA